MTTVLGLISLLADNHKTVTTLSGSVDKAAAALDAARSELNGARAKDATDRASLATAIIAEGPAGNVRHTVVIEAADGTKWDYTGSIKLSKPTWTGAADGAKYFASLQDACGLGTLDGYEKQAVNEDGSAKVNGDGSPVLTDEKTPGTWSRGQWAKYTELINNKQVPPEVIAAVEAKRPISRLTVTQIGRASCRERV